MSARPVMRVNIQPKYANPSNTAFMESSLYLDNLFYFTVARSQRRTNPFKTQAAELSGITSNLERFRLTKQWLLQMSPVTRQP